MNAPSVSSDNVPAVTKVGGVVLRICNGQPQVLLNQPYPRRKAGDIPRLGLPRGTRMYRDVSGTMVDADHDGSTLPPEGAMLESVHDTFAREIGEEANITPPMLEVAQVKDLGVHAFPSSSHAPYPIHWFGVLLDEVTADALPLTGQKDAEYTCWESLAGVKALVVEGRLSPGYVPVIEQAIQAMMKEQRHSYVARHLAAQDAGVTATPDQTPRGRG